MLTDGPAPFFVSQQINEFGELDIGARRQCRQAFSIEPRHSLFDRKQMGRPSENARPPEAIWGTIVRRMLDTVSRMGTPISRAPEGQSFESVLLAW